MDKLKQQRVNCKTSARLAVLATVVYVLSFTGLTDGVLTVTPMNVLATVGQSVKLFCSSQSTNNAADIVWLKSSMAFINNRPTTCSSAGRTDVITTSGVNNCDVTFNPITINDAGPMACQDPLNAIGAVSTIVLLSTAPTCGPTPATTVVTRGSTVTFSCTFNYKLASYTGQEYPAPTFVNTQWAIPGVISPPTTPVRAPSGTGVQQLTTTFQVTATGTELPSYTCSAFFTFQNPGDPRFSYALNTVSASCTTQPVAVQDPVTGVTPPIAATGGTPAAIAATTARAGGITAAPPAATQGPSGGVLSVKPSNAIATVGQSVKLFCSSQSAAEIVWLQSGQAFISNTPTTCSSASRTDVITTSGVSNCDVTFNPVTTNDAGPLSCQDLRNAVGAFATVVLLTQDPVCGVTPASTVVTRGSTVTISCTFNYKLQSYVGQVYAPPTYVNTQWTIPGQSTIPTLPVLAPSGIATQQLTTSFQVIATGTQLPAYTCNGFFSFQDPNDPRFSYALNTVSASCTTQPVTVLYCPSTVTITPSLPANSQVPAGTVFTCDADSEPDSTYTWTITPPGSGTISTTSGSFTTLTSVTGPFTLTCTASAAVGSGAPCNNSTSVTGIAPVTTAPVSTARTTAAPAATGPVTGATPAMAASTARAGAGVTPAGPGPGITAVTMASGATAGAGTPAVGGGTGTPAGITAATTTRGTPSGGLIVQPVNVLATVGQSVKLFCSVSPNTAADLVWLQSYQSFVSRSPTACSKVVSRSDVSTTSGVNNCDVTFSSITDNDAGPMACQDAVNTVSAFSTIIVLTQAPSCGVTPATTVVTRGSNVTINCTFNYKLQSYVGQVYPPPTFVNTQWNIPGQSSLPTVPVQVPSGTAVRQVTTSFQVTASGTQLPSYTCSAFFTFQDPNDPRAGFSYALNSLSASCTTQPFTVQYCPSTVTITPPIPANGQVSAGTVFNCAADSNPASTYSWSITGGGTISTTSGSSTTLTSSTGPFTLTCTASAAVGAGSPCTNSTSISGTAVSPPTPTVASTLSSSTTTTTRPGNTGAPSSTTLRASDTTGCPVCSTCSPPVQCEVTSSVTLGILFGLSATANAILIIALCLRFLRR